MSRQTHRRCVAWPKAGAEHADLGEQLPPMRGLRGSRGRCWYAYYPYLVEFGEEFSTEAISGILEPGASDLQMRDFSGTEN